MRGLVYRVEALHDPQESEEALQMAMAGSVWIDPAVDLVSLSDPVERILGLSGGDERQVILSGLNRVDHLTNAEQAVLTCFGHGWSTKGIARELGVSPGTVESHVNRIYTKLFGAGLDDTLRRSVLLAKIALIRQLQE